MKKLIVSLVFTALISTVIFFSCTKVDNDKSYISGDAAFVEQAKSWFNTSFVNTVEYKNGTANGNIKIPNWKYGKTYNIGNTQVAEFPLIMSRKKVYISETLTEANSRRIIDNTKFKVLFVKAPGKLMEVRIIQFTPSFNYLQSKSFNLDNLSFKDYTKEFKGDFMMFDFDNNLKKGYHFADGGIKTIKLTTKFPNRNNDQSTSSTITPSNSEEACDNVSNNELDPNCTYTAHITYSITCTGGWNSDEGFNPDYCSLVIESVYCEMQYCNGNSDLTNCLNQGNTQEECICGLYGICGEDDGNSSINNDDGNNFAQLKEILNNINNLCLNGTLNQAISSNLENNLTNILHSTFGGTDDYNINFLDNALNDQMKDGNTSTLRWPSGRLDFTITLNTEVLPDASKEYTAATIYHEIIHAYLTTTGVAPGTGLQHNTMANEYVTKLTSSLLSLFPNMDPLDAKALAWGGLQETPAFDSIRVNHPSEYTDLLIRNSQHRISTKGTPCQ